MHVRRCKRWLDSKSDQLQDQLTEEGAVLVLLEAAQLHSDRA